MSGLAILLVVHFVPPENPHRVGHAFTTRVKDCQAAYAGLNARGAEFLTPPATSSSSQA